MITPPLLLPYIDTTLPPSLPTPSLTSDSSNTTTILSPETPEMSESNLSIREALDGLVPAGYRPVWHWRLGFPGEIPGDIADHLYPDVEKNMAIIGPLSSLFWLGGSPELCELIYDPSYVLTDEVHGIPHAASFQWLFVMLRDEGKIPRQVLDLVFWEPSKPYSPTSMLSRPERIPAEITDSVKEFDTANIFPFHRTQNLPAQISMVKARLPYKWKEAEKNTLDLQNRFIGQLGGNLLFRGLSRSMLIGLMGFFTPVVMPGNRDNEFGPGFYTTTSLEYALGYSRVQGVILVFQNTDFRHLESLRLEGRDWESTTAFWAGRTASNIEDRIPHSWRRSDVLEGAVSTDVPGFAGARVPGEYPQVVGTSPAALLAFSAALRMIIWLE